MREKETKAEEINWRGPYQSSCRLYENGEYPAAFEAANDAVNQVMKAYELTLRKRMWSARFAGYKNEQVRVEMYKIARQDALQIISMSEDVEMRNSAIKLLILLPEENVRELCRMGMTELEGAYSRGEIAEDAKNDLVADLMNSYGAEVKKDNPEEALQIFLDAYELVTKSTTLAGHLMQNAGTCLLMMANAEKDDSKKLSYLEKAVVRFTKALDEYPRDQAGHRANTEKKLVDAMDKAKQINPER